MMNNNFLFKKFRLVTLGLVLLLLFRQTVARIVATNSKNDDAPERDRELQSFGQGLVRGYDIVDENGFIRLANVQDGEIISLEDFSEYTISLQVSISEDWLTLRRIARPLSNLFNRRARIEVFLNRQLQVIHSVPDAEGDARYIAVEDLTKTGTYNVEVRAYSMWNRLRFVSNLTFEMVIPTNRPTRSPVTRRPTPKATTPFPSISPTTAKPTLSPTSSPTKANSTSIPTTQSQTSIPTTLAVATASPTTLAVATASPTTQAVGTPSPTTLAAATPSPTSGPTKFVAATPSPTSAPTTSAPTDEPRILKEFFLIDTTDTTKQYSVTNGAEIDLSITGKSLTLVVVARSDVQRLRFQFRQFGLLNAFTDTTNPFAIQGRDANGNYVASFYLTTPELKSINLKAYDSLTGGNIIEDFDLRFTLTEGTT